MSSPVTEGDVILDKYRVERVLGKGGMGVVVAATHVELEQRVALKFLLPEALAHPDVVERFAREAKAAAKIQSQHVARVLDTGRMPTGAPFIIMEYLEGRDLSDVLAQDGPLPIAVAIDHVLQACEAIAEAHAAGIIHRDLKPANLFLAKQRDRRAIIKVLDFGISKIEDPKSAPLTRTATMMGSPQYMSPEQLMSSKDVDPRTDIWSLGVILYELIGGERPFDADTMPEIVAAILNNTPTRLSTLRPEVTLDLELAITRCLSTFPHDRYASVAELASALGPFASDANAVKSTIGRISRVLGGTSIPPAEAAQPSAPPTITGLDSQAAEQGAVATKVVSARVKDEELATQKTALVEAHTAPALAIAPVAPPPSRSKLAYVLAGLVVVVGGAAYANARNTPTVAAPVTATASAAVAVTKPVAPLPAIVDPVATADASAPTVDVAPPADQAPSAVPVPAPAPTTRPSAVVAVVKPSPSPLPSPPKAVPSSSALAKSPLQMGIK